jgi:transcriptional regulator with XRE-family HTH domain
VIRISDPAGFPATARRLRHAAGLTQRELARKVGVTNMAISLIELGKSGTTLHTLLNLADALGYDLALIPREDAKATSSPLHGAAIPREDA